MFPLKLEQFRGFFHHLSNAVGVAVVLVNVLLPMGRDLLAQRPVLEQGADQGTGLLRSAAGQQVTMGLKMAEHGGRCGW